MRKPVAKFYIISILIFISTVAGTLYLYALGQGISGRTRKDTSSGCSGASCHTSTPTPTSSVQVTINGPGLMAPGETKEFSVELSHASTVNRNGGVNIAVSNGTLSPISSALQLLNQELTHTSGGVIIPSTSPFTFRFNFQAPLQPGSVTTYAIGKGKDFNAWNWAPDKSITIANPAISYTPSNFTFVATRGDANPQTQTLQIRNSGGGTLSWNVTDNQSWLRLTPTFGSSTGEFDNVSVIVENFSALPSGAHSATITITASGASNSPQPVPVTLNLVDPAPTDWTDVTSPPLGNPDSSSSAAWGDYDNDGDQDLYLVNHFEMANKLYRNDGASSFSERHGGTLGDAGNGDGSAWGDYDNDGDLDLYLSNRNSGSKLFRNNNAGGSFTNVTSGTPLGDTGNGTGVAWADYDNDGDIDLYLVKRDGPNRLFRNNGGGSFTEVTSNPMGGTGRSWGVAWANYDNDGDLDVYVSSENQGSRLFRNNGSGNFSNATSGPLGDTGYGTGIDWGDFDNDGDLDLFLAKNDSTHRLFRNNGGGNFVNVARPPLSGRGRGRGVAWGDYDNDGDLDLFVSYAGDGVKLFRNDGNENFVEVTSGPMLTTRGNVSLADYDNDGDLDVFAANFDGVDKLLRNNLNNGNKWLHLNLKGTTSNAAAIGARVRVVADGKSQIREVSGGSGFMAQNSLTVEFGLGRATNASLVEIRWPSGIVQTLNNVSSNQILQVTEPAPTPPTANFTASVDSGFAPLTVQFTDASTPGTFPITAWSWDFDNNGSVDATAQNPSFTYATPGTYTVKLTVTAGSQTDVEIKNNFIRVNAIAPPNAAFNANPTSGLAPLTVQFTDTSTPGTFPITAWSWDFDNDDSVDATIQNPLHEYKLPGRYTVKLAVTAGSQTDVEIINNFITVRALVGPTAAFSANPASGFAPLTVQFTDASVAGTNPITLRNWDFDNNGTVDSNEQNPSHTYALPDTYTVKLTVSDGALADDEIKIDFIKVQAVPPTAAFSANVTSGEAPLSVQFTDTSAVGSFPIILRNWDFDNDGTVDSNDPNPSFIYTTPDTYTVKLTVSDGTREDAETKVDYIKASAPPGLLVYPGDTDNNGMVNQEDVMPLGRFWNATGPSRPNASMQFVGQRVLPWLPEASTYADATGDGVVNQLDVFPIGLNWGLTHSSGALHVDTSSVEAKGNSSVNATLQISVKGAMRAGAECWIELHALDAINLFGLCFELNSVPATAAEFLLAEPGKDIGDDVLCFYHADKNAGAISVGITRKAGQGGSSGKGVMARINMRLAESLADGQPMELSLQKLLAVDANNVRMILSVDKKILVVGATQQATPAAFDLAQNYPNPFNPETKIEYSLPKASRVRLEIFGLLGQRIKTLVDGQQPAGFHALIWDGRDDDGRLMTSGVYVYQLTAEGFEKSRKLLLLK